MLTANGLDDSYEKGAVTRIACKNFMTYDFVECTPGPHLNMVIGPNGTGKSTIVSAIALGLGYSPKVSFLLLFALVYRRLKGLV